DLSVGRALVSNGPVLTWPCQTRCWRRGDVRFYCQNRSFWRLKSHALIASPCPAAIGNPHGRAYPEAEIAARRWRGGVGNGSERFGRGSSGPPGDAIRPRHVGVRGA